MSPIGWFQTDSVQLDLFQIDGLAEELLQLSGIFDCLSRFQRVRYHQVALLVYERVDFINIAVISV